MNKTLVRRRRLKNRLQSPIHWVFFDSRSINSQSFETYQTLSMVLNRRQAFPDETSCRVDFMNISVKKISGLVSLYSILIHHPQITFELRQAIQNIFRPRSWFQFPLLTSRLVNFFHRLDLFLNTAVQKLRSLLELPFDIFRDRPFTLYRTIVQPIPNIFYPVLID